MDIQGNIVDVEKERIFPGTVHVEHGRIKSIIADPGYEINDALSASRPFILPGFVDAHIHLEMTHVEPSEYVRLAVSKGTVGAVADCHDVVNVLGMKGEEALIANAKKVPFHFGFSAPSTLVKGVYELDDVEKLLAKKEVTNLGELQNFPDVLLHERWVQSELAFARKYHKPADGSSPGLTGDKLDEYCASEIATDHWCTSYDNALEKIHHGMSVILQIKKLANLTSIFPLFKEFGDKLMFSGQNMYTPAIASGYIDVAVEKCVTSGGDLFGILMAACITPVKQYKLDVGTLHEGDSADFILVGNLEHFEVKATFIRGKCVYSKIKEYVPGKTRFHKMSAVNKFNAVPLREEDLRVSAFSPTMEKLHSCELKPAVNVIAVCDGESNTVRSMMLLREKYGFLNADVSQDCIKVVLYDRYHGKTKPAVAFIHGFGIKTGAAAMSVSHDAHNIVAVGVEDRDIVIAVNRVVALKGGIALSVRGKIRSELPFPIAGLMSNKPFEQVNSKFDELYLLFKGEMGCTLSYPIETLSSIANPQLPSLKLTLEGIMNVVEQEIVPLVP